MITLSNTEVQQFTNLRAQAVAGTLGYWQIYQTLADLMATKGAPATDQSLLWLRGATEANADRGAMAALIRTYTDTQYQLRYGVPMPAGKMQEASNEIAKRLLSDLVGDNPLEWPKGQVPDIARIALADARAVGAVLFNGDLNDTAAELQQNSAWSGSLLFSLLRSDQTGKLVSTGASGSIDTLNDVRDVLYAYKAYSAGFAAARSAFLSETQSQAITDSIAFGATVWGYVTAPESLLSLKDAVVLGTDNPTLKTAFQVIGNVGTNKFLDMLMGAVQGKSLIGTTTDVNFSANAQTFLGSLSATQLQAISAKLLPIDASGLTVAASANTTEGAYARAALAALSVVSVQTSNAVAAQFSLYSPATGQGNISALWISDRAAFTAAHYSKLQSLGGIVNGSNNLRYFDASSNTEVLVGAGSAQRAQYLFGGQGADTLNGQGFADHLYGGAGNDIFNGLGGNDYLEGGAGIDNYQFSGTWGLDTIVDTDGQGFIQIDGTTLTGGAQYGDARVSRDAQDRTYTQVGNGRLIVDGSIIIESYSAGTLGLTMTGAVADVNPVTGGPAILGDLQTNKNDLLYDTPGNDSIVSGTGNDQVFANAGGSDIIDAGTGQDIVYGGLGNDVIFGGADGDILVGEGGNDRLYANGQVTVADAIAAGNSQTGTGTRGDWLAGGTGNDTLVGSNGNDALFGGGGQDLLIGGAGVSSSVVKLRLGSLLLDLSNGDARVSCKRGLAQSTVRKMTNSPRIHSIISYKNSSSLIFGKCHYCHLKQVTFKGITV